MKTKIYLTGIIALILMLITFNQSFSQEKQYNENEVRYKIADMQLGNVYGFYKSQENNDADTKEAVKRWEQGIRVANISEFERIKVGDKGWSVVHKGTNMRVNGADVDLTHLTQSNENEVRYKIADMQLGNVYGFYKGQEDDDTDTKEAVRRWENGVRVANISDFERKIVGDKGWSVVHKGTNMRANGVDIKLTPEK